MSVLTLLTNQRSRLNLDSVTLESTVTIKNHKNPSKNPFFNKKIRILEILRFLRVISLDFNARNGSIQIFDFSQWPLKILATGSEWISVDPNPKPDPRSF